jgi:hypothetical protein
MKTIAAEMEVRKDGVFWPFLLSNKLPIFYLKLPIFFTEQMTLLSCRTPTRPNDPKRPLVKVFQSHIIEV